MNLLDDRHSTLDNKESEIIVKLNFYLLVKDMVHIYFFYLLFLFNISIFYIPISSGILF